MVLASWDQILEVHLACFSFILVSLAPFLWEFGRPRVAQGS